MRRSWISTRLARTCATPIAMPGDAATPASLSTLSAHPGHWIDPLPEAAVDELGQRGHGCLRVVPLAHDGHGDTVGGHQREQAHDALAVGLLAILDDLDLRLEGVRRL